MTDFFQLSQDCQGIFRLLEELLSNCLSPSDSFLPHVFQVFEIETTCKFFWLFLQPKITGAKTWHLLKHTTLQVSHWSWKCQGGSPVVVEETIR